MKLISLIKIKMALNVAVNIITEYNLDKYLLGIIVSKRFHHNCELCSTNISNTITYINTIKETNVKLNK